MSKHVKKVKSAKPSAPAKPTWAQAPAPHDYPAAGSYLNLLALHPAADILTTLLAQEPTVHQFAKDILRASALPLLPPTDPQVVKDLAKMRNGTPWSPILLIRGDLTTGRPLTIADGYHRVCASYHLGEDTPIPCRIATVPTVGL
jgi:hypothetical protein